MKKIDLIKQLQNELDRTYHNATISSGKYICESDYESDLVQSQLEVECSMAISDIKYEYPEILNYGEVYQWGRGGKTLAPQNLVSQRGGSSFRIKNVDELEMSYNEMRKLLKVLKKFNDLVEDFCNHVMDSSIEFVREEYEEQIKENDGRKRVYYSGYKYV